MNGHPLELDCRGGGEPTVILEGGTGAPLDAMAALQDHLATNFTVCAYERASVTAGRTLGEANQDLHDLIVAANLSPPFAIVGQSIGGDLAQMYARIFPDDVVGVVSMNSGPPCPPWRQALESLVDDDFLAGEEAYCSDTGGSDRFDLDASYAEAQAAPAPPDIPLQLLISSVDFDWCPPDSNPPEPFASQEQCRAAKCARRTGTSNRRRLAAGRDHAGRCIPRDLHHATRCRRPSRTHRHHFGVSVAVVGLPQTGGTARE